RVAAGCKDMMESSVCHGADARESRQAGGTVKPALSGHWCRPPPLTAPSGASRRREDASAAQEGAPDQGSASVSLVMPTAEADSTSSLDCSTRLAMVFSITGRPAEPWMMARSNGAGMDSADATDSAIRAVVFSARPAFFAA